MPLLAVQGLDVARGGLPVLQGVTFRVPAGGALILRGPNGIGKTTLLRTIAGLQSATAGSVAAPADSIAYGAHADGLKATLTVFENLAFWAKIYGNEDVKAALAALDLAGLSNRLSHNLSAGQKRRLGLARLLVTGRPIWVLDEPTVSLDAASVALFLAALRSHMQGGGAVLMATHIDPGLDEAQTLDLSEFKATATAFRGAFDDEAGFT